MNHAVKILEQRRDELTDGLWSLDEQRKNLGNLRDAVERAEASIEESELELEQIADALRALGAEVSA